MMIQVKLIASYRIHLPPGAKNGVVELDVLAGTTVREAISRFDIPLDDTSVIVVNGLSVDLDAALQEGDTVTAFSAIAGGSFHTHESSFFYRSFPCTAGISKFFVLTSLPKK